MRVIGFATQFYTLWDVQQEKTYQTFNGVTHQTGVRTTCSYIQNISTDLGKVKQIYPTLPIWEELRGISNREYSFTQQLEYPFTVFPRNTKGSGDDIMTTNWVGALFNLYDNNNANPKSRVLARRRLIELGQLVRYTCFKTICESFRHDYMACVAKRRFCTKYEMNNFERQLQLELKQNNSMFLHNEGDKVELQIKEISRTGFSTQYGYTSIVTYQSIEGNEYTYKGSCPIECTDEIIKVKATIKHNEYNGVKQTLIQRVKVIN